MPTEPRSIELPRRCVVLAGGLGRRIGGDKPRRPLAGRPLVGFPIAAARSAGLEPLVVAKADTDLSGIDAPVLREADRPSHPLLGIATALDAIGKPLVVCPCDLPLLEPAVLAHLASLRAGPRPRLIVSARGPEPLLGVYPPLTAPRLQAIVAAGGRSDAVLHGPGAELEPLADAGGSERSLLNVNDLASLEVAAEALLIDDR